MDVEKYKNLCYHIYNFIRKVYSRMKRIIALLLVLVMAVSAMAACAKDEGEIMGADEKYSADDIVMKTENFSYTRGEFSVIFYLYVNEFFSSQEAVDFYNIDVNSSFKDQMYYQDTTWFDYFKDISVSYMETVLVRCEGAKAAGIELSEEDNEAIKAEVDRCVRIANDLDYTVDEYFNYRFGPDGSKQALKAYLEKDALAIRFDEAKAKEYSFTDEDRKAYIEKNKDSLYAIDYITYTFDEDNDANAKAAADALAKITDAEEFDKYIVDYMTNTLQLKAEEITTDKCYKYAKIYDKASAFSEWAFNGAEAGTTYVKANEIDGQYTVYLLTKAAGLRDEVTKNVRVLLVDVANHETSSRAKIHAEDLLSEWQKGEATVESFEALVKEKSDDEEGKKVGGVIEGLSVSDDLPRGMYEWLCNSETKVGDAAVYEGVECYYVVCFAGDGDIKWEMDVENGLMQDAYTAILEDIEKENKVETFEEIINSLDV